MVKSSAETVEEYLNELPAEKRKVVKKCYFRKSPGRL
jgi:DNA-directed RNA polymerase specialized sigma24 family protein